MSLLRVKNGNGGGGGQAEGSHMPTMRPVTIGRPLVTMSTYQERGETLKRTSIMPDDSCYRNSTASNSNSKVNSRTAVATQKNSSQHDVTNGAAASNGTPELPPPPPQFANPQPRPQMLKLANENGNANGNANGNSVGNGMASKIKQPMSPMRSASISVGGFRPPATPQPDYDAVQLRGNHGTIASSPAATYPTTAAAAASLQQQQQQRRTLRLGTVTIGEYGEQRTKRETLRKVNGGDTTVATLSSNGILKNGSSRSSASFSQHGEKTIKFGN